VPVNLEEAGLPNRLQNRLRRGAGLDRIPVVAHQSRRFRIRRQILRHEGYEATHVGFEQSPRQPLHGRGDLEQANAASRLEDAQKFLESPCKIANVA